MKEALGDDACKVLVPFDRREVITLKEAAHLASRSVSTVRSWCATEGIARKLVSRDKKSKWAISKVALMMLLDGKAGDPALWLYQQGDRKNPAVLVYFERAGLGDLPSLWNAAAKSAIAPAAPVLMHENKVDEGTVV